MAPSNTKPIRILGGVFGLPEPGTPSCHNLDYPFLRQDALRLASGRGAFSLLVRVLSPKRVWLPSYLCAAIVEGFTAAGTTIEYFSVGEDLRCEETEWLARIAPGDLVLRIHYFGFPNHDPVFQMAIARGARVIDDAAQALLSKKIRGDADYVVYSPRKFLGVPDGGCLLTTRPLPGTPSRFPLAPTKWWNQSLSSITKRRNFDLGRGDRTWFSTFQSAERQVPSEPFAMSTLTTELLLHAFDYSEIATRQRANYLYLLENLLPIAMYPCLPDDVVPLGFPVRISQRDAVRAILFKEQIFPPIHWPLDPHVPSAFSASYRLALTTMTLPCDHRYDVNDMNRMLNVLRICGVLTSR